MKPLKSLLEKLFWIFAPCCALLALVASYQTFHYFAWGEAEGEILSIAYTCHSTKKVFWQKYGTTKYYYCNDEDQRQKLANQGYVSQNSRRLELHVQIKTQNGDVINSEISEYQQDVTGIYTGARMRFRYSKFATDEAEIASVVSNNVRDFWLMTFVSGILALFTRKMMNKLPED